MDYTSSNEIQNIVNDANDSFSRFFNISPHMCKTLNSFSKHTSKNNGTEIREIINDIIKFEKVTKFVIKKVDNIHAYVGRKDNKTIVASKEVTEILISSFISKLYKGVKEYCIHCSLYEGYFFCGKKNNISGHIIMEKLDGNMYNFMDKFGKNENMFKVFLFQIIFSLRLLAKYKIVHTDLHTNNIMYINVNDDTYFGEKRLNDFEFFRYSHGRDEYYVPNIGVIFKIFDLDFASKYSNPKILMSLVLNKVYEKQYEIYSGWHSSYDFLYSMYVINRVFNVQNLQNTKSYKFFSKFINNVYNHTYGTTDFAEINLLDGRPKQMYSGMEMSWNKIFSHFEEFKFKPLKPRKLGVMKI
jgi:predicted DNA-binding protein